MKTKSLILAGLAVLALVSCNKEKNESPFSENGDSAYLAVKIAYANGAATRATGTTDEGFIYGDDNENELATNKADFFFYMEDGAFFQHVTQTIETSEIHAGESATYNDNVEEYINGIVVLKGLTSTKSPKYMAVVLNGSSDLIADLDRQSMTEAHKVIEDDHFATETSGVWSNFTMTNSTYEDSKENVGDNYCAVLTNDMFKTSEAAAAAETNNDVAVAYVERIAAKVTLTIASTLTPATVGTTTAYKVDDFELNNSGTKTALYAKIIGWGLNGTEKTSYAFKNIKSTTDWTTTTDGVVGFDWNVKEYHRSYWAMSTNYGLDTYYYPRTFGNDSGNDYSTYNAAPTKYPMPLNYYSYNDCKVDLGSNSYCRENTNTKAILDANNFNTTATCVLLTAQIVDATGTAKTLYLYENKYWDENSYLNRVLAKYVSNVYEDNAQATPVKLSDLSIVNAYDGLVYVEFNTLNKYYDKDGNAISADDLDKILNRERTEAVCYNNGMMYYSIPIEHLRKTGTFAAGTYMEADYGVVRNHWYKLEISKIANLGHGVYDSSEKIVPDDNDTKKYYVAAKINILSWNVVKQSVEL